MGMTAFYGGFDRTAAEEESLATITKALELGLNFFDTAWIYQSFGMGTPNVHVACLVPNYYMVIYTSSCFLYVVGGDGQNHTNEELLGKAIAMHGRDKFVIATKFGIARDASGSRKICNKEETLDLHLADSLKRLGTDYIDLYYIHRIDPSVQIEDTIRALKRYVEAVRYDTSDYRNAHRPNSEERMPSIQYPRSRWSGRCRQGILRTLCCLWLGS
jgi:aryl-alcohol dehydrogenase-like predicted oxidoreductase